MAFERSREDIRTIFAKDPAVRSVWEAVCCYPGLHAIWMHRAAHFLYRHHRFFAARLLSHINRFFTGIEIHPGARIGRRVFIDHGMGVVIGETAEVGDDVLIYMGVVLGGTALERVKRHPTIGNRVVIGSGASVLGPITVGDGAKVGAGAVVVRSVPPGATVVGVPGRLAGPSCPRPEEERTRGGMPDPMLRIVSRLLDRQNRIDERLRAMEHVHIKPEAAPVVRTALTREEDVREALHEVIDPEVGINIVDLGMVRDIIVEGDLVEVDLVLTTQACPIVESLTNQVRRTAAGVEGIRHVEVRILDEPWDWDRFVRSQGMAKGR